LEFGENETVKSIRVSILKSENALETRSFRIVLRNVPAGIKVSFTSTSIELNSFRIADGIVEMTSKAQMSLSRWLSTTTRRLTSE
jgi:hypothetical protein